MDESRLDSDRVVMITTIVLTAISVTMYLIAYLTLFRYGFLNDAGRTFAVLALVISAVAMLLACYLAITGHSQALTTPGLSGLGYVLICAGLMIGAPALGLENSHIGSFGGVPAALFMLIAGAAVLQAEHNARQTGEEKTS